MLNIKEALELKNILLINEEVEMREELIKNMVGDLYPSILWGEIFKLRQLECDLRIELRNNKK